MRNDALYLIARGSYGYHTGVTITQRLAYGSEIAEDASIILPRYQECIAVYELTYNEYVDNDCSVVLQPSAKRVYPRIETTLKIVMEDKEATV